MFEEFLAHEIVNKIIMRIKNFYFISIIIFFAICFDVPISMRPILTSIRNSNGFSAIGVYRRCLHSSIMKATREPFFDLPIVRNSSDVKKKDTNTNVVESLHRQLHVVEKSSNLKVLVSNTQKVIPINKQIIQQQIYEIKKILGIEDFQIDVLFASDLKIKSLNKEARGKNKSTDILSFPICDFVKPGIFTAECLNEGYRHLGDLAISPSFLMRQINQEEYDRKNGIVYEDDENDAGVSKEMSNIFCFEKRLCLLLIHGVLHLIGYDHETEEEWKAMVTKEEEVIEILKLKGLY